MSQPDYTIRPDDFRNIWTVAYQQAMGEVAVVVRCADTLLDRCSCLMEMALDMQESTSKGVARTTEEVTQMILDSSRVNSEAMTRAARELTERSQKIVADERRFREYSTSLFHELEKKRKQLEIERSRFPNLPLYKRLWCALNPSEFTS